MSLKGFHILFICLATLCSGGFWAWAAHDPDTANKLGVMVAANLSGSFALFLLGYGIWFVVKKSKTILV